jgi:hypothetical protein
MAYRIKILANIVLMVEESDISWSIQPFQLWLFMILLFLFFVCFEDIHTARPYTARRVNF